MTLSKAARAEREAKRLEPGAVERANKGREAAEQGAERRGPGRPRKDGSPPKSKAKTIDEAKDRVRSDATPATTQAAPADATQFRDPTRFEINSVKFAMKMGNKPLVQLERDLEEYGVVSEDGRPPALVKKGEIPASEEELEMGAEATAATLVNFTPSLAYYMAPITLAMFTVGFIGSRLVIFLRIKRAMDQEERRAKEAQARADEARSKLNPTAVNNGTTALVSSSS